MTAIASLVIPAKLIRHAEANGGELKLVFHEAHDDHDQVWLTSYEYTIEGLDGEQDITEHGSAPVLHQAFGNLMTELDLP